MGIVDSDLTVDLGILRCCFLVKQSFCYSGKDWWTTVPALKAPSENTPRLHCTWITVKVFSYLNTQRKAVNEARERCVWFRTESVLHLDWVSFEKTKQTKTKPPQTKNPFAAQFPSFRWKGNYGDWRKRSDVTILRQSNTYILQACLQWGRGVSGDPSQQVHQWPKLLLKESPGAVPEGWQLLADAIWELQPCSPAVPTHPLIWHPPACDSNDAGFGAIYRFCVCSCLLKGEAGSLSVPRVNTLSGSSNTYFMTWLLCFNRLSSSSSTWAGGLVAL